MCGIVGILKLYPGEGVAEERLKRMRDTLRRRGSDGEGLLVEGSIGLGHRRLAIVDPKGGRQPMANEDKSVWIVCNGEMSQRPLVRDILTDCKDSPPSGDRNPRWVPIILPVPFPPSIRDNAVLS